MEQVVLYIGFAILAGILAGYMTARLGTRRMVLALWSACAVTITAAILWSNFNAETHGLAAIVLVYGVLVPFAGCAIVAAVLGIAVRSLVSRGAAE